jgi:hypothetical protein
MDGDEKIMGIFKSGNIAQERRSLDNNSEKKVWHK